MIQISDQQREALEVICRRRQVARLEVFGSAAGNTFDPASSDVDLLVQFLPDANLGPWLSGFTELRTELVEIFARPVDLLEDTAIRNTRLRESIDKNRVLLYAA
jgi:uncharacterized protein